jgi:hypothetical protein
MDGGLTSAESARLRISALDGSGAIGFSEIFRLTTPGANEQPAVSINEFPFKE